MNNLIHPKDPEAVSSNKGETSRKLRVAAYSINTKKCVTIVIPVLDALDLTKACLTSIRDNTPYDNYEIIIVDNGSADKMRSFLEEQKASDAIRIIRNRENLGFAKACNQGIRSASGHYILLLNNDTVVTPGWLDALILELEHDEKVGIVGSCLLYPAGTLIQHVGVSVGMHNGVLFPYHVHRLRQIEQVPEALQSRNMKAVTGACMLVRREVLESVSGLDEKYVNGYEDIDFCLQALKSGFQVRYCARSRVYHYESMTKGRHDHDGQNLRRLNEKWKGIVEPDEDETSTLAALNEIWAREELQRNPGSHKCISMLRNISFQRGDYEEARECEMRGFDALPTVSIIIPTYNNLGLTTQCLESIHDTTPGISIEIVCVDNASSDGTVPFLKHEESQGKLVLANNGQNLGFAKACNQGAKLALGEFLVFLNNDTVALDGWLQEMIRCMETNDRVGMVGSKLLYPEGSVQHAGVAFGADGVPFHIYRFAASDAPYVNRARELTAVTGACFLVRREVFLRLGGFDEKYENGLEDVDLCLRLKEEALRILYCPKSTLYHLESVSEGRFTKTLDNYRYFFERWGAKLVADDEQICAEDGTDIQRIRLLESSMRQGKPFSRKTVIDYKIGSAPQHGLHTTTGDSTVNKLTPSDASLLSIIILSLNQGEWTRACLESIRKHTTLPYEIIVVDNGSTNETVGALLEFCSGDPCISIILNARNEGFAGGNNQGMNLAKGDSVLLLNNDTLVTAEWLEGLLRVFTDHPGTGIVGPMSNHVAGPQIVEDARYNSVEELEAFSSRWRQAHRDETFSLPAVIGFCMLIGRNVIEAIGGLDPLFGIGNFEDIDYCYRASLSGFGIRVARDVFIHHQGSLTFKAENVNYVRLMKKNWELFKAKWGLEPGLDMGQGNVVLNKELALRQFIALPRLQTTHQCDAEGKLWFDTSKDSWPGGKPKGKTVSPAECGDGARMAASPRPVSVTSHRPAASTATASATAPPQVSVIIPTYENLNLTRQCLEGILHHTADIPHEIIVVDNHSTDGTRSYLREMESKGILKAVLNPLNMGFAHACNQGAQVARYPFLLFLNNDTFPMEGWMKSLLQTALRDESAAIIGTKLLYPDGRVQHAGMKLIHFDKGRALKRPIPGHPHRFAPSDTPEVNEYRELDMVTGACILVRKKIFFLLGGFDEVFRNGVEDVDLCLRARCAGYKVVYQPGSVVIHHEGQSPGRFDKEPVCRNLSIYFARWGDQFGPDGRLIIPKPPRVVRSQNSILNNDAVITPETTSLTKGPEAKGLRIC